MQGELGEMGVDVGLAACGDRERRGAVRGAPQRSGRGGLPVAVEAQRRVAARWRPTVLPSGGQQNCPR